MSRHPNITSLTGNRLAKMQISKAAQTGLAWLQDGPATSPLYHIALPPPKDSTSQPSKPRISATVCNTPPARACCYMKSSEV